MLQGPDDVHGSTCESCTECSEDDFVTLLDAVLVLVEAQVDAGGTRVAAVLDVDHHLALVWASTASMMRRLAW